ncbi:MAG: Methionine synthase II cobalamin-independent MetE [Candidatus Methanohalarchaeum thermophilum]|uniref:Methionine synthase II cobalamin-independent MetE n=1 Tax=Methanohalarchaeum thermophilum TaxID=1903181 RepID=A0A1Q6DXC9_METT1|nr:MAG: Methionine synthase II cobalamin-independent MetE [Candidatus Methanohalarchaeum thermophilum]
MSKVLTSTSGFFPRPSYLREKLKDVTGHQKESMGEIEEVKNELNRAREEVINLQKEANIDLLTTGQLTWDDLLAYPCTQLSGVEMNGLIRYYSTNRFYRKPVIEGELNKTGDLVSTSQIIDTGSIGDFKFILPGPISFLDLVDNKYYENGIELMKDFSSILIDEINRIEEDGVRFVQLDEPSLTKKHEERYLEIYKEISSKTDCELILNTYFGSIYERYPILLDLFDWIGLDLVDQGSNWKAIKEYGGKKLQLGLIDSWNTKIEEKNKVLSKIDEIEKESSVEEIIISSNIGLDFLPWDVMKKKLDLLREIKRGVKGDEE